MGRFAIIAFAILTMMAGISVFNEINNCYCGVWCGNESYAYCLTDYGYSGTGHRIVEYQMEPMIKMNTMLKNEKGEVINVSSDDFNKTIQDLIAYKSPGDESLDFGSVFTFGLNGLTIMINTFFLPVKGLPDFLGQLGVPTFIVVPIITFIVLLMIIGIIEFVTSRVGWF
jgi:hypothetical protein